MSRVVRSVVTIFLGGLLAASSVRVSRAQSVSLDLLGGVTRGTLAVPGSIRARYGVNVGARLFVGPTRHFGVLAGALYVQKGGTAVEQGIEVTRDDFNFLNVPLLVWFALPTRDRSWFNPHFAFGPTLEPDLVWGGSGWCLMALAGLDLWRSRSGAVLLELTYIHGLYDMQYKTLEGMPYRTRTFALMVGYSIAVTSRQ